MLSVKKIYRFHFRSVSKGRSSRHRYRSIVGKAILAQQEELWQDALIYWQAIIEQAPQDTTALFGASLAASQLSEKAEGKERQRLWQSAEKHFRAFPDEQLTAAVLSNWGEIYQSRGEAACDSRERELWFDKAAEKYAKATKYAPDDITSWCNWGVLCQSRGTAAQEKSKQESGTHKQKKSIVKH